MSALDHTYTHMYTYIVMPNKTIYVKDADLPLLERAQEQLGESVSSMFAEFLKERVAQLTPEEHRIIGLINQISRKREAVKNEHAVPQFVIGKYEEAEAYAEQALKSLRAGEIRNTKTQFYAANAYYERAESDLKDTRELNEKIAQMLEPERPTKRTRK
jgi:hypothetical protein